MSDPAVNRIGTAAIVTEIVNRLKALQWTPAGASEPTAVFERVEIFDNEDLVAAFRFLLVTEQRVALVVPLDEEFKPAMQGVKIVITRRLPVVVLVVDQVLGDRAAAFMGSTDPETATPGALGLAEYVLPAVTGMLLGPQNKVVSKPLHSGPFAIQDPQNQTGGSRLAVAVELECTGGRIEAVVGAAPEF